MSERYEELQHQVAQLGQEMARLRSQQAAAQRRHRLTVLALLAGALVCLSVGRARTQETAGPAELTATKLTINGDDGKPVLIVGSDKDGGRILIRDRQEHNLVTLGADKDGGYVNVHDTQNKGAVVLALDSNGRGGLLNIYSNEDKAVVILATAKNGGGSVEVNKGDGKIRSQLATDDAGGRLWLLNNGGETVASYPPK